MIRTVEKTIGDVRWGLNTLSATDGLKALGKLTSMTGGALRSLKAADLASIAKGGSDPKPILEAAPGALAEIASQMGGPDFVPLVKQLLSTLTKNGRALTPAEFDMEMAGEYALILELTAWAIQENFGGFFGGLKDLVERAVGSVGLSRSS